MRTISNPKRGIRTLTATFIGMLLSLTPYLLRAQEPLNQAWSILQDGATNKSSDQRIATMRVLQLIPGNAKAVDMAEQCLQDKDPDVRGAAATALGTMQSKSAIPQLTATAKSDPEGAVVMAAAKSLIQLGDEKGYEVFYAVVTGTRKSGGSLVADQKKELDHLLRNPKQMEGMAFEQGIGYIPYGGIGLQVYQTIHTSESKEPILKASSIRTLAKDPDPRSGKVLVAATKDKNLLVRAAAFDALARRGDSALLPDAASGLNDDKEEVKLTAAAAVVHLSTMPKKSAK
jgi:HEAT repeat protein